MLNTFNYYDIIGLSKSPKSTKFIFENIEYSTYLGKDNNDLLINSFKDGSFKAKKLTSFIFELNNRLGIENNTHIEAQAPQAPQPVYDPSPTLLKLTEVQKLSPEFLETMQLSSIFKDEYITHSNIKKYNNKHEVLYCEVNGKHNIRFKWNGSYSFKNWSTLKADTGITSTGAYFKGSNKTRSTLILCEGMKDGINANIAFPQCDILVTDSKNQPFDFGSLSTTYKTIILFQDEDVTNKEMINLFKNLKGDERSLLNKFYYVDNAKRPVNTKDVTDFLQSLNKTKAQIKKSALSELKKILHKDNRVSQIENNVEIEEKVQPLIEKAKSENNIKLLKKLTKRKLFLSGNIEGEADFYIKAQVTPPTYHTEIPLSESKYLGNVTAQIIEKYSRMNKILLGSPTGTGKSTFAKGFVMSHFKRVLIIAPLKKVASEMAIHSESDLRAYKDAGLPIPNIAHIDGDQGGINGRDKALLNLVDLQNCAYVSITTDVLYNLIHNNNACNEHGDAGQALDGFDLIIFDEQHIVHQSHNFRGKVVWIMEYLATEYNGKVLAMSGTPIFNDLPNFHPITCTLDKKYMSKIKYFLDPFKDEKELVENIRMELKKGNVLIYSKSVKNAKYIQAYLRDLGEHTVRVTGDGNSRHLMTDKEGVEITDEQINDIKENVAIISTTRATTGANFKRLSTIYQFGSAYDPHTFIQLVARIRGNGKYYYIKMKSDMAQDESVTNKAVNILKLARDHKLEKLSGLFRDGELRHIVDGQIDMPHNQVGLEKFLKVYKSALQVIQGDSLGVLSEDKLDFEFPKRVHELEDNQLQNIFTDSDSYAFTKYIERAMIDYIQRKGNVEILNSSYNLSFDIEHQNPKAKYKDAVSKAFITDEDATEKKAESDERKTEKDKFKEEYMASLSWILNAKNHKKFKDEFSDAEISSLLRVGALNLETHQKAVTKPKRTDDQLTRLRCYLIPKSSIIKETMAMLSVDGYATCNGISARLEQNYRLTMRTKQYPYAPFIKAFFSDLSLERGGLSLIPNKKVKGETQQNVIVPSKELREKMDAEKRSNAKKAMLKQAEKRMLMEVKKQEKIDNELLSKLETKKRGFEVIYS